MNTHRNLNFVPLPKQIADPVLDRRTRVIAQLEEQKLLIKDPTYMRPIRSWVKNEQGEKTLVEKKNSAYSLPGENNQTARMCSLFDQVGNQ